MSALPYRTTLDDVVAICTYLAKKPTGASTAEAKKVVDSKLLDFRKLAAYKAWGLVNESDGRLKISDRGRSISKGEQPRTVALKAAISAVEPYVAILERVAHRGDDSLTALEVAAHWHEHFGEMSSGNEQILNDQAVCFFQLAQGAGLGQIVIGRKGQPTRFNFAKSAVEEFAAGSSGDEGTEAEEFTKEDYPEEVPRAFGKNESTGTASAPLSQGIFIAHGKNKKPLEQLRRILDQFKVPYKVATEEPNLGSLLERR